MRCWKLTVGILLAVQAVSSLAGIGEARGAEAARIEAVRVGFDGAFKVGCWSPIQAVVAGPPGALVQLRVTTPDPDGNPCVLTLDPVTLATGTTPLTGVFRSGLLGGSIRLELLLEDRVVDRMIIPAESSAIDPLTQRDQIWLVSGDQPAFRIAANRWNSRGEKAVLVGVDETSGLLDSAFSLDAVDVVVLGSKRPVPREFSQRLRLWTSRGGRLVITIGEGAEQLRTGDLANWLPLLPVGTDELRELGNLKELIPGSSTLRVRGSIPAGHLSPSPSDGLVLARSLSGPLIVRSAYGLGEVTLLAVELDRRPLSTWDEPAQADLAVLLANLRAPWSAEAAAARGGSELNPTGVGDLQTQLLNTLDHFDAVPRPTQWTVLGWIALLLVFLGPVDYLVVHKLLRRPHWTWITFPCWVLLISAWSLNAGARINEAPLTARQVDLVDVDQTLGTVRSRSWLSFYSPDTRRYRIHAAPGWVEARQAKPVAGFLGWPERPESGFRGMHRSGGADLGKPSYEVQVGLTASEIDNFPVRIWSSGTLQNEWERSGGALADLVRSDLHFDGVRLNGAIAHLLPGELTDWFIAYESFAYFPRRPANGGMAGVSLPPQTRFDLKRARSNLLRGVLLGLTQNIGVDKDDPDRAGVTRENYDPLTRDPFRVARVLTFHDATGGAEYTGLANAALQSADLSHLLALNRAILFGRLSAPATEFTLDGSVPPAERRDTFVRVILPVDRKPRDPNAPPPPDLLRPRP